MVKLLGGFPQIHIQIHKVGKGHLPPDKPFDGPHQFRAKVHHTSGQKYKKSPPRDGAAPILPLISTRPRDCGMIRHTRTWGNSRDQPVNRDSYRWNTPKHDIPISPLLSLPSTSENPIFRLRGSLRRHPNNRPPHLPLTSEPPPFPPPHSSSQQSQPCRYSQNLQQQATKFGDRLDMADDQHEEVSKKVSAEEEIRRGITVMRRVVQGRSRGIILDVYWNNQGQLIEPNGHTLTSFIGALVRNEIPITCDDWRNKELNESKEKIWSEIKRCFNIEEERRGFCMKLAGKLLRGFQTFLSSKFLKDADGNFVDAELPKKYESLISAEEWEAFKSKRQDPVFQRISATNRERASSPAYPYRKGRVGYGRLEQSMLQKEESSETSLPAHVLWKEARVGKSGVPQEEVLHVYQKCEELSQSLSPDDTKGILSRALDVPEYSGRVRGKGFGVTPTSLSIKKGKAPSNRELHARLEAMQAELDALRREREASASTVYRDASDKNSINCTFQPNIPEGISHCQLYLSSPYYRMVGKGKVHNVSGVLLHTRELPAGCLKVSVDIAVEPNAALPYPSDDSDATTVHEAVGSFVAWPTNLICVGYEKDIMTNDGEINGVLTILSFSYKLFVKKCVADVVISTIAHVDETNFSINEEIINGTPLSEPMKCLARDHHCILY
ncbi:hypothetical protein KIW84_032623 [Lathyrus oleraceus]|uniref:DUF8039 domain-containing protein n=1 Tax=Pisum sativum TaxID=3888 RepID=A0A9D4XUR1_PEA|nr:hypothetical protein KIW84_032623 [Pisum sativum]